jgi:hypothetical protein
MNNEQRQTGLASHTVVAKSLSTITPALSARGRGAISRMSLLARTVMLMLIASLASVSAVNGAGFSIGASNNFDSFQNAGGGANPADFAVPGGSSGPLALYGAPATPGCSQCGQASPQFMPPITARPALAKPPLPPPGGNLPGKSVINSRAPKGIGGMATWAVSEPYLNSWIYDEPLGYQPGLGDKISFTLAYKQRESRAGTNNVLSSCGQKWNCSWISYLIASSPYSITNPAMILPGGGERAYTADGLTPEYYSNTRLTALTVGATLAGYGLSFADGSVNYYTNVVTDSYGDLLALLSATVDPAGHAIQFRFLDVFNG